MSTAPASAARKFEDWDRVWLSAQHEAAHAAAAWHFGWCVDEVVLREDGGDCFFEPPAGLERVVREHSASAL